MSTEPPVDSEEALSLISSAVDLIRHYRETDDGEIGDDRYLADAWLIRHRRFLEARREH